MPSSKSGIEGAKIQNQNQQSCTTNLNFDRTKPPLPLPRTHADRHEWAPGTAFHPDRNRAHNTTSVPFPKNYGRIQYSHPTHPNHQPAHNGPLSHIATLLLCHRRKNCTFAYDGAYHPFHAFFHGPRFSSRWSHGTKEKCLADRVACCASNTSFNPKRNRGHQTIAIPVPKEDRPVQQ